MIFYTDHTTEASNYCLLHIKNLKRYEEIEKKKADIILDCGVIALRNRTEFPYLSELIRAAESNKYRMSIDYVPELNPPHTELFIKKTNDMIERFKDNPLWIVTPHWIPRYIISFIEQFELNKEKINGRWFGLGLGRYLYPNIFTDNVINYLIKNRKYMSHIHIYGASMRIIRKYVPKLERYFSISVDQTKWTKPCDKYLKEKYNRSCLKSERNEFFIRYMHSLSKTINKIYF
ncbi:MAG: hypothetical protein ACTSU2_02405 [Promethearchaeota archaeon]